MESREKSLEHAMHLINIDIQDNHEEATIGAFMICELITMVCQGKPVQHLHEITRGILSIEEYYSEIWEIFCLIEDKSNNGR
jgi:hypothetical protein